MNLDVKSERSAKLRFAAAFVLMLSMALPSHAGQQTVVFYLDANAQYRPVTRLDRMGPMPEATKAILAMYALESGGGCEGNDDEGLRCELTRSLELGAQCSEEHLNLVSTWFKDKLPAMSGYAAATLQSSLKSGQLERICYNFPPGSTVQSIWEVIKVKNEGRLVSVDAIQNSTDHSGGETFYRTLYKSEYRVNPDNTITVISHKGIPLFEKK
jgi:hypothetical protein